MENKQNVSVIIPAFNEAKTVSIVIDEVLKLKEIDEVILVNDGSIDNTTEKVKKYLNEPKFIYLRHPKNKGKGAALKTGIDKAKNEVILLLDADLQNISVAKIRKIINPVLTNKVDLSRAGFKLARGRVTEIAVKPMMRILFPGVYFDQPISGQVCAKKSFLQTLNFETKWGVDIGILLDAIQAGQRIVEVDIGELVHKARPDKEKAEMAEQVLETMVKKAGLIQHKYKLVIFTLDNTLVQKFQLQQFIKKLDLKKVEELQLKFNEGEITFGDFIKKAAPSFKDLKLKQFEKIAESVEFIKYAPEVIGALKRRKYQVAILSSNFSPIVIPIAKKLGVDLTDCVYLENINGKLTGKITERSSEKWALDDLEEAFGRAFVRITQRAKVKPLETIMVANSPKCVSLFLKTGLAIAFKPEDKFLKEVADKTISILPELLAIME